MDVVHFLPFFIKVMISLTGPCYGKHVPEKSVNLLSVVGKRCFVVSVDTNWLLEYQLCWNWEDKDRLLPLWIITADGCILLICIPWGRKVRQPCGFTGSYPKNILLPVPFFFAIFRVLWPFEMNQSLINESWRDWVLICHLTQ